MFNTALPVILKFEGGYVNDPDDRGGATNKGITQATYDAYRKSVNLDLRPVKEIEDVEVAFIYERDYWNNAKCDVIDQTKPKTALVLFDAAVNHGVGTATRMLQRVINTRLVDGIIGRQTLRDLSAFTDLQVASALIEARRQLYGKIVANNPSQQKFLRSWMWRLNKLEKLIAPTQTNV